MRNPLQIGTIFAGILLLYAFYALWPRSAPPRPSYLPSATHIKLVRPAEYDRQPYRIYVTSPLTPPVLDINATGEPLAEGLILLAPRNSDSSALKATRPFIFSSDGELVWGGDSNAPWTAYDLRVQTYKGNPHLTYWRGYVTRGDTLGHGYGEVVFVDGHYREFNVSVSEGLEIETLSEREDPGLIDLHEQEVTERDTLLVTAYNHTPYDLSHKSGAEQIWVTDSLFLEIEIATEKVLFVWSALAHVDLRTSHLNRPSYLGDGSADAPYDFFHITSVQAVDADHFLVNSRHMWSTYLVSRDNGTIVWEINGATGGDFGNLPDNAGFRWTHHAQAHNVSKHGMTISWMDNHHFPDDDEQITPSRGLVLQLRLPPNKKTPPKLLRHTEEYQMEERFYSTAQGSYQTNLTNNNQFLCYGDTPVIAEHGSDGKVRWQARYAPGHGAQAYRAYKQIWHATPAAWDPVLEVQVEEPPANDSDANNDEGAKDGKTRRQSQPNSKNPELKTMYLGFVSWNGATDVEVWEVYVGPHADGLQSVGRAEKKGFETVFRVQLEHDLCVQVGAVQGGQEVRRSNVVCL